MSAELILFAVALLAAALPFLIGTGRSRGWLAWSLTLTIATVATAAAYRFDERPDDADNLDLPRRERHNGFVSSRACKSCHPGEYRSWHESYHRTMTQSVSRETVLANFDDVHLESRGRTYHLTRDEDGFWAEMVDPAYDLDQLKQNKPMLEGDDLPHVRKKIVMSTGSHNQQTYWVPLDGDRTLFQLPWSWIIAEQRWIPREDAFLTAPSDERTPAVWNGLCIRCHSTAGRPEVNPLTKEMDSEVADLGIACEACHGPGQEHIDANRDPIRRYKMRFLGEGDTTIVQPAKLPHDLSSMVCGQCHSFHKMRDRQGWLRRGDLFRAGDDIRETRKIAGRDTYANLNHSEFWPDGTYRVGGREFNGLLDSACYKRGELSCLSCHSMHDSDPVDQLSEGMRENEACLQCHDGYRADPTAHTHHPADSRGSNCYNCHMPHTTYALFKSIRSHTIDSPDIVRSVRHGRPNACNLCHLDKTMGWTRDKLAEWYGQVPLPLSHDEETIAASVLWLLKGDAGQRMHMAWHYGWRPAQEASGNEWMGPYLAQLLDDPYGALRHVTYVSLRTLPGFADFDYDFIGPPRHRRDSAALALQRWRSLPRSTDPQPDEVLIGPDGALDRSIYDRLLARRDDRPIRINE